MTTSPPQAPIAIVGIAAQLPSGNLAPSNLDHKQFFEFLLNKGEAYERIPLERFNIDSYKGKDAGRVSTEYGTFLKHTDQLDRVELGITNKDARAMSLSTRKLIELSFLALLDSGIDYRGQNVGCFASGIVFDILSLSEPDEFEAQGSFSGPPAMIANRISYHLDLLGPSVPVDTACSSSLTATHLAVQAIRSEDCEAAVVAGIQLNHRFVDWVQYSQGGILSPDGKCKPFDSSADGFSRGEAGVAIVLKRLDKAIEDGDYIYATILGTGINSAGSAAPVNAPVAASQRNAMRRAWAQTDRKPQDVDFVEVHATGTAAGDPTEANWVGEAFQRDEELLIGSVKGNIGHTEIAAFLVSLTKCIHIFQTGIIPPNVNLSTPNPRIDWNKYHLHVPTECTPLPCHSKTGSLISLCSSGIGGANGHVVLEAPPRPFISGLPSHLGNQRPILLVAGALSPRSISSVSDTLSDLILEHPDRSEFLSTVYGRRSRQMPWRSYAIYSPGQTTKLKFSSPSLVPRIKPPIVFVFAGQGPQHLDMGREMFNVFPAFRKSILQMDLTYAKVVGNSLISSTGLFQKDNTSGNGISLGDVWPIEITLPALTMVQCALVDLFASVGISPDIIIGHSAGETAVLYASGAGTKEMAVELAIARGKAMALVESAGGTMAAISCGLTEGRALIAEALEPSLGSLVDIGCHNSSDAITLSGMESSIDKVINFAESRGIMARKLRTRVPVHSGMMDICRNDFKRLVGTMWASYPTDCRPEISVYSTLTGEVLQSSFTADYFWDGTRNPVLFAEAMSSLLDKHPSATFLELSPHPVLSSYISALGAARNEISSVEVFSLSTIGHNSVNFSALNNYPILDPEFRLPAYPFTPKSSFYQRFQDRNGPLNFPGLRINSQTHPVLAQHVIKGEPIMPAAGFIEMALEFGATELWDVDFRAMMSLSAEQPISVEVKLEGLHWTVKTSTTSTVDKPPAFNRVHAEGFLSLKPSKIDNDVPQLDVEGIIRRCKRIDLTDFYEDLGTFAEYGPSFQRVVDGYRGEDEVLVLVQGDDDMLDTEGYRFHPAILDCCLHFMVHKSFTLNDDRNWDDGKVIFHYQRGSEGRLRTQLIAQDAPGLSVWLFSESGFNGDAGMGFSRSLRREYPLWDIHFVIFERTRSEGDMVEHVSQLSSIRGLELDILIDSKEEILIPKVIPSPPPSGKSAFQPSSSWLLSEDGVVQSSLSTSTTEFVQVNIIAMSCLESRVRGFVGRVSSGSLPLARHLVVGLAIAPNISSVVSVHHSMLSRLPDALENSAGDIAGAIVGFVIAAIGGDVSKLRSTRCHRPGKALLSQNNGTVIPALTWFLRLLDFEVIEIKSDSPSHLASLASQVDLIFSGVEDPVYNQVFLHSKARVFMWNDPQAGLAANLDKSPCHIGDTLDFIVSRVGVQWPQSSTSTLISDISLPDTGTLVPSSASLFDFSKAYLLIGGIGGVGIRVALWMYQRGARYLVLTSRSGKASLGRVQDRMALRILAYLESCPDLRIRIEASDATSEESTYNLLRSIPPNVALGGCMLLTAVLSDRTFAFSNDKDYDIVFASKTGACSILNKCIAGGIPALDFFISFSSVVGLFGNGGQSNYAGANTALDGMVRKWDNSFTFILPAVTDGGGLASETREQGGRLGHLTPWGISSQHICDCLEDGIRKLSDGPFWQYIPDLDWSLIQKYLGSSRLFSHLVNNPSDESGVVDTGESGQSMTEVIIELLDVEPDEFDGDVPFTAYGLDSLSAARLSFALRPFVEISQLQLLSDISLNDLQLKIERVQAIISQKGITKVPSMLPIPEPQPVDIHIREMDDLIEKYTRAFPMYNPVVNNKFSAGGEVIFITGTTGAIGASMLAQMTSMESISRIYAFNRGDPDKLYDRQVISLRARGYDEKILEKGKVVLVAGDHSKHDLGISPKLYEEIRGSVTAIIHNAWPVNFTDSLASFEPSIRSVRVLVDLALASSRPEPPRLLLLSSIGIFYNRKGTDPAPEEPIFDGKRIIGTGYSESKWIAERILLKAGEKTPLRPIIVRAGQICGGNNGAWNTTEWFPALVKSAIYLGSLPEDDGNISWTPLHTAAKALIEMLHTDRQVLHLSHPRPIAWSKIANFLSDTLQLSLKPYEEWLRTLEASASAAVCGSEDSNPALRLLYYFKALEVGTNDAKEALGLPKLSVTEAIKASSALRDADQLTTMDAAYWVNNWENVGFLRR
ncbi:putative polyketide synthase [Hysterangium stoloniferum]|nr:putative polyketide synthase [Hysterangium stoloniferum]